VAAVVKPALLPTQGAGDAALATGVVATGRTTRMPTRELAKQPSSRLAAIPTGAVTRGARIAVPRFATTAGIVMQAPG
jgi:hypothetical protein